MDELDSRLNVPALEHVFGVGTLPDRDVRRTPARRREIGIRVLARFPSVPPSPKDITPYEPASTTLGMQRGRKPVRHLLPRVEPSCRAWNREESAQNSSDSPNCPGDDIHWSSSSEARSGRWLRLHKRSGVSTGTATGLLNQIGRLATREEVCVDVTTASEACRRAARPFHALPSSVRQTPELPPAPREHQPPAQRYPPLQLKMVICRSTPLVRDLILKEIGIRFDDWSCISRLSKRGNESFIVLLQELLAKLWQSGV